MPTSHSVERPASDPHGTKTNTYLAGIFGSLNPTAQNNFVNTNLNPQQQAQYNQARLAGQNGMPQSGYNNQIGDLLYSLMGLSGYGSGSGYGGRGGYGGGGGGGSAPPDIGLELGLQRDKINADRSQLGVQNAYTASSRGNQVGNELIAQLQQNMQRAQAPIQFNEQKRDFMGGQAAKGALTTAGSAHDFGQMRDQYHQLLKQLSLQNQGLQYGRAQSQQDFDYANSQNAYQNKQNDFDQQGLDITAGKAGYVNPFTIPNPTPVQRKTV